ncbi:STAS domain-containing protein [Streptomyces capparidis]
MTESVLAVDSRAHSSGTIVLTVSGELDHHTSRRLTDAVKRTPFAPGTHVVIDLSGLTYCDSTGITVLITAYNSAKAAGSRLTLAGLNADLMRIFRIVGLDQIFTFRPTVGDAVDASHS